MQRAKNVVLYVMYRVLELTVDGLVTADQELSHAGMDKAKRLIDSGFRPTPQEITDVILMMRQDLNLRSVDA